MAHVAQLVEHVLGKDEVTRSIRVVGSKLELARSAGLFSEREGIGLPETLSSLRENSVCTTRC